MAGVVTRTVLILAGIACIAAFLWTLTDPAIPKIWIGGVLVGVYLIYRGAVYNPRSKPLLGSRTNLDDRPSTGVKVHRKDEPDVSSRRAVAGRTSSREAVPAFSRSRRSCIRCGEPVESNWLACPSCGADYREICRFCGHSIDGNWIACPYCSSEF